MNNESLNICHKRELKPITIYLKQIIKQKHKKFNWVNWVYDGLLNLNQNLPNKKLDWVNWVKLMVGYSEWMRMYN